MRLSPRGLFRWYARCCDTPICNTLARPGLPFVGVQVSAIQDPAPLGRVRAHTFLRDPATGRTMQKGMVAIGAALMTRMISSRLSGRWRETPFFDPPTGAPVATPVVLDLRP